ncbi:MAG: hypothetical protein SFU87_01315 [Chitinophagaceae bacterium]|nr:hypothetical protein [Chitinophagaceae bacterium]
MKKLYSPNFFLMLVLTAISIAHCAKKKEEIQKNIVIEAMTSGRWIVQGFTENSVDVSSEFTGYEFQFYENGTVQGIKSSATTDGSWLGDPSAMTIFSSFPSGNDTLKRLNDTWKIINNTFTLVEARPTNTNRTAYLKLVKK